MAATTNSTPDVYAHIYWCNSHPQSYSKSVILEFPKASDGSTSATKASWRVGVGQQDSNGNTVALQFYNNKEEIYKTEDTTASSLSEVIPLDKKVSGVFAIYSDKTMSVVKGEPNLAELKHRNEFHKFCCC